MSEADGNGPIGDRLDVAGRGGDSPFVAAVSAPGAGEPLLGVAPAGSRAEADEDRRNVEDLGHEPRVVRDAGEWAFVVHEGY